MAYNYSKLRGRIVEKYGSCAAFSKVSGMSERTLSLKMSNKHKRGWTQEQIQVCCDLLEIPPCEVADYFFTPMV